MPRARLTVRGLMIAVAIAGLAIGATVLNRRSRQYERIARDHAGEATPLIAALDDLDRKRREHEVALEQYRRAEAARDRATTRRLWGVVNDCAVMPPASALAAARSRAAYHMMMAEKYERAARYPWLPVPPDPPEPE